jgi:hypothetical protein
MKKLLMFLIVFGSIAAVVAVVMRRRSEGSFDDTWGTFTDMGSKVRDAASGLRSRDVA